MFLHPPLIQYKQFFSQSLAYYTPAFIKSRCLASYQATQKMTRTWTLTKYYNCSLSAWGPDSFLYTSTTIHIDFDKKERKTPQTQVMQSNCQLNNMALVTT